MQYICNNSSPLTNYSLMWSYHHRSTLSKYKTIHHPICEDMFGHNQRFQVFKSEKVNNIMLNNNCTLKDIVQNKNLFKKLKDASTKKDIYAGTLGPWQSLLSLIFMGVDGLHGDLRIIILFVKHTIQMTLERIKNIDGDMSSAIRHYLL
eukprot:881046_1